MQSRRSRAEVLMVDGMMRTAQRDVHVDGDGASPRRVARVARAPSPLRSLALLLLSLPLPPFLRT